MSVITEASLDDVRDDVIRMGDTPIPAKVG